MPAQITHAVPIQVLTSYHVRRMLPCQHLIRSRRLPPLHRSPDIAPHPLSLHLILRPLAPLVTFSLCNMHSLASHPLSSPPLSQVHPPLPPHHRSHETKRQPLQHTCQKHASPRRIWRIHTAVGCCQCATCHLYLLLPRCTCSPALRRFRRRLVRLPSCSRLHLSRRYCACCSCHMRCRCCRCC